MERQLPTPFTNRMESILQKEYPAFLATYEEDPKQGLRVNPLKLSTQSFLAMSPFALATIPWCKEGFTYKEQDRPGKHPYHSAGLYYLQEPSAMAVVSALGVQPGEVVLDLCAAPGGKSTQIAGALQGTGMLVSNEIHPVRAKALSENIERLGVRNAIVTNEPPERLAERFPQRFDRILVDAPCSGEGMFRKLPEAIDDWSEAKVLECHRMQIDILDSAADMLKPGGTLVYSTCTFAPLENEQSILLFLQKHPEFTLAPVPHAELFSPGLAIGEEPFAESLKQTARLWPHKLGGEGHYIAKLIKQEADSDSTITHKKQGKPKKADMRPAGWKEALTAWQEFVRETLPALQDATLEQERFVLFGDQLYYLPEAAPDLAGLRVIRPGWHLGAAKKNRFEPSHALALSITADAAVRKMDFPAQDPDLLRYLRGETITLSADSVTPAKGWTLICVDGFPIGWSKSVDGQLKNHYPKGLRWL